jgi:hypothetical protein
LKCIKGNLQPPAQLGLDPRQTEIRNEDEFCIPDVHNSVNKAEDCAPIFVSKSYTVHDDHNYD